MIRKAIIIGAVIGIAFPLAIMSADSLSSTGWWPDWILWVWPSSYMLIATAGKKEPWDYFVIALSIAVNAALYCYIASLVFRGMCRAKKQRPDAS